jgi:hypothetical protein
MDRGNRQGPFTKYIMNPIRDAITKYRVEKKNYIAQARDLIAPIKEDLGVRRAIEAPEINYTFESKAELLGAVLHTGNQSNLEKLLLGYGWAERLADGSIDTSRWDRFVMRMWADGTLTKAHYDAIQGLWDLMEKLKPDAQKAHKSMFGYYFNEITAKEISTPFGTYRGGYMPAKTDPDRVRAAANRANQAAIDGQNNTFAFPTTGRGATKTRVERYTAPLQLDIRLSIQHIDWALRFTYLEPRVREVGRIAMSERFQAAVGVVDSEVIDHMVVPWLQRVAAQTSQESSASRFGRRTDRMLTVLRRNASLQMMSFNLVNAIQNFTIFPAASLRVRPGLILGQLWKYAHNPTEFANAVAEKSPYMSTRLGEQANEIENQLEKMLDNPTNYQLAKEWLVQQSKILQVVSQNMVELSVWSAAYSQAIEQGSNETEAVRAADAVVVDVLGSQAPEDISAFEHNTAIVKALSMFYGFFNNQANLGMSEILIHKELGLKERAGKAFYAYLMIVTMPAILGSIISRALGNGFDDDDDGEYIDDILDIALMSQFKFLTAMVPGGTVMNSMVNAWNDKAFDDRITISPIATSIEKTAKAPLSIAKAVSGNGKASAAIKDSLTAIGFITGLPGGAVARPLGYWADVGEGVANPTGPVDFARGTMTGKPGPKN